MLMHPVLPTQGHDTVSTLLMWILMELGRRPALQERLRSEVDAALGDEVFATYEQISPATLPLAHAVVKESLRLKPSAPMVGRELESPLAFRFPRSSSALVGSHPAAAAAADASAARNGGEVVYTAPAGTLCAIDIISIHTNPHVRRLASLACEKYMM